MNASSGGQPDDARPYRRFFPSPVRFDAEHSALVPGARTSSAPGAQRVSVCARLWKKRLLRPPSSSATPHWRPSRPPGGTSQEPQPPPACRAHDTSASCWNKAGFDILAQLLAGTRRRMSADTRRWAMPKPARHPRVPPHGGDIARWRIASQRIGGSRVEFAHVRRPTGTRPRAPALAGPADAFERVASTLAERISLYLGRPANIPGNCNPRSRHTACG